MQSRWKDEDAATAVARHGAAFGETLALRTYSARLLGAEKALVLHGGGNTSAKSTVRNLFGEDVEVLFVKGSGWDLASMEPPGHPAVRLTALRRLRQLSSLSDEAMVNELRLALLDASAPTPSVETLLHAYLPARFVDHTHADAVLALVDQPDAAKVCADAFGPSAIVLPYTMAGFELAQACAAAYERAAASGTAPTMMVLENHGIFTWGDTAKESYGRMIAAVTTAERFIADRRGTVSFATPQRDPALVDVAPRLRGVLARLDAHASERGPIVRVRSTDAVLSFLERRDAAELVARGCATPDHVLRTKPTALLVDGETALDPIRLESAVTAYARDYDAYFGKMVVAKEVRRTRLPPWPRVLLVPRLGIVAVGSTAKEADVTADVYEHTVDVMLDAVEVGDYVPLDRARLFDMEYWSLEQAKLTRATPRALDGALALITGAASGIGRATVTRFLAAGAHVTAVDRDGEALERARGETWRTAGSALHVAAVDVTNESAVAAVVHEAAGRFGGLDVVVSNAGDAPEGDLATAEGEAALRASLDLNLLAHNHVARAALEIFTVQGNGGCLLFNASKAAFNPGPRFGPYAVAKAALIALMRQYAIDHGGRGVRSNAVNADRIRTGLFPPEMIASRAHARGLSADDYFRANLLGREVTAEDVASAFLHLAEARATTGCVVTVDGGNAAAFPR